jgi:hypothetical protein
VVIAFALPPSDAAQVHNELRMHKDGAAHIHHHMVQGLALCLLERGGIHQLQGLLGLLQSHVQLPYFTIKADPLQST